MRISDWSSDVCSSDLAQLPVTLTNLFQSGREGAISGLLIIGSLGMALGLVAFICFMELAQRRVLSQYPKRQTRKGIMQADRSHMTLKGNTEGVSPPLFDSSRVLMHLMRLNIYGKRMAGE